MSAAHPSWCVRDRDDDEWMTHVSEVRTRAAGETQLEGWIEQADDEDSPRIQADGGEQRISGSSMGLEDLTPAVASALGELLLELAGVAAGATR